MYAAAAMRIAMLATMRSQTTQIARQLLFSNSCSYGTGMAVPTMTAITSREVRSQSEFLHGKVKRPLSTASSTGAPPATIEGKAYEEHTHIKIDVKKGMTDALIAHLSLPDGLPYTLSSDGAIAYYLSKDTNDAGEESLTVAGFWEKKGQCAAYASSPKRAEDYWWIKELDTFLRTPRTQTKHYLATPFQQWYDLHPDLEASRESGTTLTINGKPYEQQGHVVFHVKEGMTDAFLKHLDHPDGLPFTFRQKGVIEYHISKCTDEGGDNFVLTGFWEKMGQWHDYLYRTSRRHPDYWWVKEWLPMMRAPMIAIGGEAVSSWYPAKK